MKKAIIILVALFTSIASFGQQYFNFANNKNFEMSFGVSDVTNPNKPGNGISGISVQDFMYDSYAPQGNIIGYFLDISIYGFYFSMTCGSSLSTGASGSISVDRNMPEGQCRIFHFGYKSPITNWLYIYPIIGYVNLSTGYCDGSNYRIDRDGIHNSYTPMWQFGAFDYGAGIDFKIGRFFVISGKFTKFTRGVSLGFVIDFNQFYWN